jgi:hypothetical protein
MAVKIDKTRTYTNEEKLLLTVLTIEEHLRFFKVVLILYMIVSVLFLIFG